MGHGNACRTVQAGHGLERTKRILKQRRVTVGDGTETKNSGENGVTKIRWDEKKLYQKFCLFSIKDDKLCKSWIIY